MKTFPTTLLSLERIFSISHEIIVNPSLEDILHAIVQTASELVACEGASIMLFDRSSNVLNFVASTKDRILSFPVPIEHSIAGAAFKSNRPLIVPDVSKDPRYYPVIDAQTNFVTHSLLLAEFTE